MTLVASEVYFHPNDDNQCATVGFRAADGSYLLLSRALITSEQDRGFGHDAVHLEINDQGSSCYNGIGAVSVFPAIIRFDLNEKGERAIHRRFVEIHHGLPPERSRQLQQVLTIVFEGFPRYFNCG